MIFLSELIYAKESAKLNIETNSKNRINVLQDFFSKTSGILSLCLNQLKAFDLWMTADHLYR